MSKAGERTVIGRPSYPQETGVSFDIGCLFTHLLLELTNALQHSGIRETTSALQGRVPKAIMRISIPNITQMRTLNFQDLTPMKSLPWALLPLPWVTWEALPSQRYRAFCQTLKQEFHLRGEIGYEKFQPRVIFPQGCHEHLKTGVYNGSAIATVTTLLQKCDTVLKYKHYNKKKHLNDAWKDNQDM